jgi:predicted short-subunit dehydrogenase-like oxidoreductase (DUF2520 family)
VNDPAQIRLIAIIGRGRLGNALAHRLRNSERSVVGPLSRDYAASELDGADIVLLCVPDREIAHAASVLAERVPRPSRGDSIERCPMAVGHCSGATSLDALEPMSFTERFSLHPLMSYSGGEEPPLGEERAAAAISASSPRAMKLAETLAHELEFDPFVLEEADRVAYHAAASMASNFLITLEVAAERLAASAGCPREALVPLVRRSMENWATLGSRALTGPIARGDTATVANQRVALAQRAPELVPVFDALAEATRELAHEAVAA